MEYLSLGKRPLFCFTLCFMLGIVVATWAGNLIAGLIAVGVCIIAALLLPWRRLCMLLAGVALGFTLASLSLLPRDDITGRYGLSGTVVDSQPVSGGVQLMLRDVSAIDGDSKQIPVRGNVQLTLWVWGIEVYEPLKNGMRVSLPDAVWEEPRGQRNPGGFNEALYLAQSGIFYVVSANLAGLKTEPGTPSLYGRALALRDTLENSIDTLGEDNAPLLKALLLGFKHELTKDTREAFRISGITHLMAVSGLHVNLLIFWVALLLEKLGISIKLRFAIIILVLSVYCAMTGYTASALRAAIMSTILLLSNLVYRKNDSITTLSASALLILCVSPLSLFGAGFQLSFGAMVGIYTVTARIERKTKAWNKLPRYFASLVSLSLGASAGVLPIAIYHFNYLSLVSLAIELAVIPLVGLIMPLGWGYSILSSFFSFEMFAAGMRFLLDMLERAAVYASGLPWAGLNIASPPLYALAAYYFILAAFGGWIFTEGLLVRRSALIAAGITLAFSLGGYLFRFRGIEIVMLDVGQGDGTVLYTPAGGSYVIDTGPYKEVTNYLLHRGTRVDALFLSHLHSNHAGGLPYLLENIPVSRIYIPENVPLDEAGDNIRTALLKAQAVSVPVTPLSAGDRLALDAETSVSVLYPTEDAAHDNQNDTSLVFYVEYGAVRILFTGDIEAPVEESLAASYNLSADILKLAHHGSSTSSSSVFIEAVSPLLAISSSGVGNRYGHPAPEVLNRLEAYGITLIRTDISGAITLRLHGNEITAYTFIE